MLWCAGKGFVEVVAMSKDKIILEGMEFYGYHGVLPEERTLGQRFIVDLELAFDLRRPGAADDPVLTVDYAAVLAAVKEIVEGRPRRLIESLAEVIAGAVLDRFPVEEVLVRVKKPQAPVPGRFAWMAVEIRRRKNG